MTRTIPKNHTRKIAAIRAAVTGCRAHTQHNDFQGVGVDPQMAFDALARYPFAKLYDRDEGRWTVHVHDNYWYELTAEQAT